MKLIATTAMRCLHKLALPALLLGSLAAKGEAIAENNAEPRPPHWAASLSAHAFYVGLTDIVFNPESGTYEVSLKVFTDDLELALHKKVGRKIVLDDKNRQSEFDNLVHSYVESHFTLSDKTGTPLKLKRIGRETEMDVTWIYLESEVMQPLRSILVSNSMMMEIYDTQSHVVNVTQDGVTQSTLLHITRQSDLIKP